MLIHAKDLSELTPKDETEIAYRFSQLSLKDRVFHVWYERQQLEASYAIYFKGLLKQYGAKCAKCSSTSDLCIDHKTPVSKGGITHWDNLQLLCRTCNSKKKDTLYFVWLFLK